MAAGDIEKYAYCPLSWWLSRQVDRVDNTQGVQSHDAASKELEDIRRQEIQRHYYNRFILGLAAAASIVAIIGITMFTGLGNAENNYIFVAIALLWLLNSVFFLYKAEKMSLEILRLRYEKTILLSAMGAILISVVIIFSILPHSQDIARFLEVLAVVWIVVANVLFYRSLSLSEGLLMKKLQYVSVDDTVAYVGTPRGSQLLKSKRYGLQGKPDYIVEHKGRFIPVEKKTGRTPKGPLFSHIVQLTAYCMLVEDSFGPVDYGLLEYDEKKYTIDYDSELIEMVLKLRQSLLADLRRGEAHRNHERKGKCLYCSRRDLCQERLA